MRALIAVKERAAGAKIKALARGLAALMQPGDSLHRFGVGVHAFDVEGVTCLASTYLEGSSGDYTYRYAVLCGGERAMRILRHSPLDPGDSDEPGPGRRIAVATFSDYDDFLDRLPKYLGDVSRAIEGRLNYAEAADGRISDGRRALSACRRRIQRAKPKQAPE